MALTDSHFKMSAQTKRMIAAQKSFADRVALKQLMIKAEATYEEKRRQNRVVEEEQ